MDNKLHIGFTGPIADMNEFQVEQFTKIISGFLPVFVFHHGDALGADATAHALVTQTFRTLLNCQPNIEKHPGYGKGMNASSTNPKRAYCEGFTICHPAKPYMERNTDIAQVLDILIATPSTPTQELRSGTWSTVRRALKLHKGIILIPPYI